jgi:predicted GNAT family N-acyltransferase
MGIEIRTPLSDHEWENYYDFRYRILREPLGKDRGSERHEGDSIGEHFALFEHGILKAIARLDESGNGISQVRFVAVEKDQQGKGLGKKIMTATEIRAKEKGSFKMILHARDYAVNFYLNLGYKEIEPSYKLFDVLQHFLMEKEM